MKLGFIGGGPISQFHIPVINNNGFKIEAIGSRPYSKRCLDFARSYNLENQYCERGWEQVLSRDIDVISICIETNSTKEVLLKSLDKNRPIFVEKPICSSLENFYDLLNHENSKNIFVGYNRRFYKTTNMLKELCDKSPGGTIYLNMPESDYGIKQFINNGCHMIDTLRYVIGDFKVISSLNKFDHKKNEINHFSALCKNEKWDILINAHSQIPSNFSITVNTDKKVYELKPIEKLSIYEGMNIIEPSPEDPLRKYIPSLKVSYFEDSKFKPGFDPMYENFKLFSEKRDSNFCGLEDAFNTINLCWELVTKDNNLKKLLLENFKSAN